MATISPASSTMRRLNDCADEFLKVVTAYDPDGNVEVYGDYQHLPDVMTTLAKSMTILHKKAMGQGFKPAVVDFVEALMKAQTATATAAGAIAPAIEKLHKQDIDYATSEGTDRWDRVKNRGNGGGTAARRGRGTAAAKATPAAAQQGPAKP